MKKNTHCMKKNTKVPPHSSSGRHLLIKLEGFSVEINCRFFCKSGFIRFGSGMILAVQTGCSAPGCKFNDKRTDFPAPTSIYSPR